MVPLLLLDLMLLMVMLLVVLMLRILLVLFILLREMLKQNLDTRRYGHYGGYGHGYYGKRDAGVIGYSAYASPLTYSGAYGYAAPATGASIAIRGYGTPATVGTYAPYGYAASGAYVADSVGAVHVA